MRATVTERSNTDWIGHFMADKLLREVWYWSDVEPQRWSKPFKNTDFTKGDIYWRNNHAELSVLCVLTHLTVTGCTMQNSNYSRQLSQTFRLRVKHQHSSVSVISFYCGAKTKKNRYKGWREDEESVRGLFSPYILQIEAQMFIDSTTRAWSTLKSSRWWKRRSGPFICKERETKVRTRSTDSAFSLPDWV